MSPRGHEKRRHSRISEGLTLRMVAGNDDFGTIELETSNLSLGGAYCLCNRSIEPMTCLKLEIFLPSTDGRTARLHYPIEVDAVVVRSEELDDSYRLALFFSGIAEKDRAILASYLNSDGNEAGEAAPAGS